MKAEIKIKSRQVWMVIGTQHFAVGMEWDTLEEAEWFAAQLRVALTNVGAL